MSFDLLPNWRHQLQTLIEINKKPIEKILPLMTVKIGMRHVGKCRKPQKCLCGHTHLVRQQCGLMPFAQWQFFPKFSIETFMCFLDIFFGTGPNNPHSTLLPAASRNNVNVLNTLKVSIIWLMSVIYHLWQMTQLTYCYCHTLVKVEAEDLNPGLGNY